jgi:hypothetical protein
MRSQTKQRIATSRNLHDASKNHISEYTQQWRK